MATGTVSLRGEGGVLWDFELPLSEDYAEQVRRGRLTAADADSAKALAKSGVWRDDALEHDVPAEPAPEPNTSTATETTTETTDDEPKPPPMVGAGSGRDAWAGYAKAIGLTVPDDMKKAAIVAAVKARSEQ